MRARIYWALLVLFALLLHVSRGQVNITRTPIDMRDNINWIDLNIALVLASTTITDDTVQLLRSTDGAQTWSDITSSLFNSQQSRPIAPLYVNPNDPSRMWLNGNGGVSWRSADKGMTWQAVQPGFILDYFDWHPKNSDWALAMDEQYNVYYTKDCGTTWTLVTTAVFQFTWGDAGIGDVPETRIYLVEFAYTDNIPYNLVQTDDWDATRTTILSHAYQVLFVNKAVIAPVYLQGAQKVVVYVSPDINEKYKQFYEAKFPFGDTLEYTAFTVLDDKTGGVYVGINHGDAVTSRWGNVYVSDASGANYIETLLHVGQHSSVFYDFDAVQSVEGVYIGNVLRNYEDNTQEQYDQLVSFFSFDNGNTWQTLKAPHFDSNGKPITCSGNCHLHLNGLSSFFENLGPFYSVNSATGLIISTGSIGDYLSKKTQDTNTYISSDAGLTWREMRKGSSIYEFGDYGGIIVAAPFGIPTDTVYYSLDEGNSPMKAITFTDAPTLVDNIIAHPSYKGRKFVLLAQDGSIYGLDFSTIFSRTCVDSDYVNYSPSNGREQLGQPSCLMGRTVVYRRRNSTAQCFNDPSLVRVISSTNCPCIEDDWECDFDYARDQDGQCVLPPGVSAPKYPPEVCPPGSDYYKTKGYRLEPGNTCDTVKGVDHSPNGPYTCPKDSSSGSKKAWLAVLVVIPIVLLCVGGSCFAIRNEKLREKVPFLKVLASWKVGYFNVGGRAGTALHDEDDIEDEESPGTEFSIGYERPDPQEERFDSEARNTSAPTPATEPKLVQFDKLDDEFNPRG